jgi:hypothetical protein
MLGKIPKNTIMRVSRNNINYTQPSEIAELFNEHFTNVGHVLAHQIPPIQDQPDKFIPETNTLYTFKTTKLSEVLIATNKLAATKASGIAKLPTKILKIEAPIISESLAAIFNVSLKDGTFPNDLKWTRCRQFLKLVREKIEIIIGLFLCFLLFQKFSKSYSFFHKYTDIF